MDEQERKALEEDKVYTCPICNEYQGTKNQLKGHEPHCRRTVGVSESQSIDISDLESVAKSEIIEPEPRTRERNARSERIPLGVLRQKLPSVPQNDGFQYRVINDNWQKDPVRLMNAKKGGYEVVEGYEPMSVGVNDDGTPIKGILMRIPKEWYDEDQRTKQQQVDKIDQAIKQGVVDQQPGDKRYSPQGIKIHSSYNETG